MDNKIHSLGARRVRGEYQLHIKVSNFRIPEQADTVFEVSDGKLTVTMTSGVQIPFETTLRLDPTMLHSIAFQKVMRIEIQDIGNETHIVAAIAVNRKALMGVNDENSKK